MATKNKFKEMDYTTCPKSWKRSNLGVMNQAGLISSQARFTSSEKLLYKCIPIVNNNVQK